MFHVVFYQLYKSARHTLSQTGSFVVLKTLSATVKVATMGPSLQEVAPPCSREKKHGAGSSLTYYISPRGSDRQSADPSMSALPVPSLSTTHWQLSLSTSPTPTLLLMAIAGAQAASVAATGTCAHTSGYIFGYVHLSLWEQARRQSGALETSSSIGPALLRIFSSPC